MRLIAWARAELARWRLVGPGEDEPAGWAPGELVGLGLGDPTTGPLELEVRDRGAGAGESSAHDRP